jgi:ribonucleoside-triphosphate reductase
LSEAPKNLDSFCGSFINLVFAIASQFAGAVSTPEFLTYLDYFIRKEYGDDYYLNVDKVVTMGNRPKTIDKIITNKFGQVVYSLNQPAAARNFQSVN